MSTLTSPNLTKIWRGHVLSFVDLIWNDPYHNMMGMQWESGSYVDTCSLKFHTDHSFGFVNALVSFSSETADQHVIISVALFFSCMHGWQ